MDSCQNAIFRLCAYPYFVRCAQFSCKLSCTTNLWNPRSGRLDGKSREAVETNAKIDKMLLNINSAYDNLLKRNVDFTAQSIQKSGENKIKM